MDRVREQSGSDRVGFHKNTSKSFANFIILLISSLLSTRFMGGPCASELKHGFIQPTDTYPVPNTIFRNKAECAHRVRKYSHTPPALPGVSLSWPKGLLLSNNTFPLSQCLLVQVWAVVSEGQPQEWAHSCSFYWLQEGFFCLSLCNHMSLDEAQIWATVY